MTIFEMSAFLIPFLILIVFYIIAMKPKKPPVCYCDRCEWEGPEEELAVCSEDGANWFSFCPECGSSKIIHNVT